MNKLGEFHEAIKDVSDSIPSRAMRSCHYIVNCLFNLVHQSGHTTASIHHFGNKWL